ncbi:MAG: efflux transporter outer membrane subunit [Pseudomonadota bacterium]|nr:efflux transporter outer membrane subunit [Pseudomonadota bacterium]
MRLLRLLLTASVASLTAALTAGCAVGPDFERPAKPNLATYDSTPLPPRTADAKDKAGVAQTFVSGQDIPATWWQVFHSLPLNSLIQQALKSNPDLAAAEAALRVAEENTAAGEGAFFPSLQADFSGTRTKTSSGSNGGLFPGLIYTVHNASIGASYLIDLFGRNQRQVEELGAQEDYQRFQMEAAYISLTSNVVTAAIKEASLRGQIEATQKIIAEETSQRNVLEKQLNLGGIAKEAVLGQAATLAQIRGTLPPLEKQLAQIRHELSVLVGQFPSEAPAAVFDLDSLSLPQELPVTLPSQLVEQRPDVRAAEANLHIASAAIGVALANRLPQITLSADIGSQAVAISKLFTPGTGIWSIGFDVSQTIFDGGRLAHQQGAAEAEYDMAAAQYRKVVLAAFQDVADALRALQSDAMTLREQVAAERAAAGSLALTQIQFKEGALSYIALLDAERVEQQTKIALIQAEAQRYADTAALFQALGGGWWNRPAYSAPAETTPVATTPVATTPVAVTPVAATNQTKPMETTHD